MILHHFTMAHTAYVGAILASGQINVTESNCRLDRRHAGPPVVWLTDSADPADITWPAVGKAGARFTVEVPDDSARAWLLWAARQGVDPETVGRLVETGGGLDAARHWYVSERPIHAHRVVGLHLVEADVTYQGAELRRLFRSAGARRHLPLRSGGRRVTL